MEYSNSYDEKIMNYKGDSWEELVSLFTVEELEGMREYVEGFCGWGFSDEPNEWDILRAYVQEWLIENIRNNTVFGTKHLLKLYYDFG